MDREEEEGEQGMTRMGGMDITSIRVKGALWNISDKGERGWGLIGKVIDVYNWG